MAESKEKTKDSKSSSWFWINNTVGKPSMSATFATVAFFTTTAAYIASIFEKVGPLSVRPFDAAACSSYLIPILTLYFGRRWTEAKHETPKDAQ